uniref:Uncharacterized protein n=1 Tax=Arion vulgaris TaxID=1028688 RepID=A0A0B6YBF2_9EUPU
MSNWMIRSRFAGQCLDFLAPHEHTREMTKKNPVDVESEVQALVSENYIV